MTVNLTEETRDASRAPGHGALWAMLIVLALFMGFAVVILLVLNDQEIQQSSTNVVFAIADKLLPRPWSYVAVIAVMLSTVGTLETSILQFTRTLYAKGRDGIVHPRYAILHKRWRTPWVATAMITAIGLLLLFGASYFPSVSAIIKDSVNAIGFQVAFYYGLAALPAHGAFAARRCGRSSIWCSCWCGRCSVRCSCGSSRSTACRPSIWRPTWWAWAASRLAWCR